MNPSFAADAVHVKTDEGGGSHRAPAWHRQVPPWKQTSSIRQILTFVDVGPAPSGGGHHPGFGVMPGSCAADQLPGAIGVRAYRGGGLLRYGRPVMMRS